VARPRSHLGATQNDSADPATANNINKANFI
jgi:hypothetical protein